MKKNYFFILMFVLFGCTLVQAQEYEYVPFVRENMEWFDGNKYRFIGDTVVDGKTYKKCYQSDSCPFEDNMRLYGFAREEDRVVYRLMPDDEQESVIYDFRVEKAGDRVPSWSWSDEWVTVARIDTILVNGEKRRRIELQDLFDGIYIEGIGSIGPRLDFFYLLDNIPTEIGFTYKTLGYAKNVGTGEYEYVEEGGSKDFCEMEYEYTPYVKECGFGYYHYDSEDKLVSDLDLYYHYFITGEKVTGGKTYMRLVESSTCDYVSGTEVALIREEGQKVYLLDGEKEWLWYDFSLEKGDLFTVEVGSPLNPTDEELKIPVTNTYVTYLGGRLRKVIFFENYSHWIEGLGTVDRLPLHPFDPDCGTQCGDKLYYQRINSEIGYLNNGFGLTSVEPCSSSVGTTEADLLRIARTPNALVVTLPDDDYRLAELIDTTGRLAWCDYLDGESGEVIIPATGLASGVYIVVLTNDRGERTVQKVVW